MDKPFSFFGNELEKKKSACGKEKLEKLPKREEKGLQTGYEVADELFFREMHEKTFSFFGYAKNAQHFCAEKLNQKKGIFTKKRYRKNIMQTP